MLIVFIIKHLGHRKMKVVTPEISWHDRDPVYSVDFQPGQTKMKRLATAGVDKFVRVSIANIYLLAVQNYTKQNFGSDRGKLGR